MNQPVASDQPALPPPLPLPLSSTTNTSQNDEQQVLSLTITHVHSEAQLYPLVDTITATLFLSASVWNRYHPTLHPGNRHWATIRHHHHHPTDILIQLQSLTEQRQIRGIHSIYNTIHSRDNHTGSASTYAETAIGSVFLSHFSCLCSSCLCIQIHTTPVTRFNRAAALTVRLIKHPHDTQKSSPSPLPASALIDSLLPYFLQSTVISASSHVALDCYNQQTLYSIVQVQEDTQTETTDGTFKNDQREKVFIIDVRTSISIASPSSTAVVQLASIPTWLNAVRTHIKGYDDIIVSIITAVTESVHPVSPLISLYPPPHVFLLHGLPGCGKTVLSRMIARHSGLACHYVQAPELFHHLEGESEQMIRQVFDDAIYSKQPTFICIDEVDAICPPVNPLLHSDTTDDRSSADIEEAISDEGEDIGSHLLESLLVAELCRQLDRLHFSHPVPPVFVLFTSHRLSAISPALLRSLRIDQQLHMPVLTSTARYEVLAQYCEKMNIAVDPGGKDSRASVLERINHHLHGYVGADIEKLCREVTMRGLRRAAETEKKRLIDSSYYFTAAALGAEHPLIPSLVLLTEEDFYLVLHTMRPANLSDLDSRLPLPSSLVSERGEETLAAFNTLAGLDDIIRHLQTTVLDPVIQSVRRGGSVASISVSSAAAAAVSSSSSSLGIKLPAGLLLYGLPGTGKSSLALSLAYASTLTPLSVSSTSLVTSLVGKSEAQLAALFRKARESAPCVLVIDQIEVLGARRSGMTSHAYGSTETHAGDSYERLLSCLLQEIDGIHRTSARADSPVFIIATTSHPELLDPALLRPGRLDYHQHIPAPSVQTRYAILKHLCRNIPVVVREEDQRLWWEEEEAETKEEAAGLIRASSSSVTTANKPVAAMVAMHQFLAYLAVESVHCSGADLVGLVRESGMIALRCAAQKASMPEVDHISSEHFLQARQLLRPSLKGLVETHPPGTNQHPIERE